MFRRSRRLLRPLAFFASLLCALSAHGLAAAEAEFVHLWPGWRDAASFERITQYFGGEETHLFRTVLRTHADARAGYYVLLRVSNPVAIPGAKFELQIIRPDSPEPKTFLFPVTVPAGSNVYDLGLTGDDWPDGKAANPVAWKLTLLSADGQVVAAHKSFLWEKPAKQ